MRSKRQREYIRGWVILAACTVLVALALPNAKYATYGEPERQHEDFIVETETEAEMGVFRREAMVVDRLEEEPEVTTVPETETEPEPTTEEPTFHEPEPRTLVETEPYFPLYMVDGDFLDEELQRFAYMTLQAAGIEWWMPYFMLTAYQESSFKVHDITDGLDYGLLQYRITYWEERAARYGFAGADIFDTKVQIQIYVRQTADRLASGCSVAETISRHKTSDHGSYDDIYVRQVMDHELTQIR